MLARRFRQPSGSVLVQQRGELEIPTDGEYTIVFPEPFAHLERYAIVRPTGRPNYEITFSSNDAIKLKTLSGSFPCKIEWVATGTPVEPIP